MANTLLPCLRKPLSLSVLTRANNIGLASIHVQDVKYLYSKSTLGLDGFAQQCERIKSQMANISEKFKEKMSDYVASESKNMIFTEDLKNMVHIADNDRDVELTVEMLKRYNKQNKSLRFGNYIFGPVVMRMFYTNNKVDLALQCFKSEEFSGIFDQYMTFQLLLDLLYENGRYKDMLEVVEFIKEKQWDGQKYPKNVVMFALAACYKLNNKDSLDYALKLWAELNETGHVPLRRATTFCAGLAVNQGKPDIALEILTTTRNQSYTTVRNLKVVALADLKRLEDIIPIFKALLTEDIPEAAGISHTFNKDVIEKVKKMVFSTNNPELTVEFNRVIQTLERQGHIAETTLDEQLCSEIQKPPIMNNREFQLQQEFRSRTPNFNRRYQRQGNQRFEQRPGLAELV